MANLAYADTVWDQLWDRLLPMFSYLRWAIHVRDRLKLERYLVHYGPDPNGNKDPAGEVTIAGAKLGTARNTTSRFRVYVRVTGGGDPRTVSWYKATGAGGGDLVAQGTANAGTTATLTQQNSSGLSGTFPVDSTVSADAADTHYFDVYEDWIPHLQRALDDSDSFGEDAKARASVGGVLTQAGALGDQLVANAVQLLERFLVSDPTPATANARAWGSKFLKEVLNGLLSETQRRDSSDAVSLVRSGAFEKLRLAMRDETTGSTQTFVRRVVAAGAAVAESGNVGAGAIASHTPEAAFPAPSTVILTCEEGLGTGQGGQEKFRVELAQTGTDEVRTFPERLTVGQAYKGPFGFGGTNGITLTRSFTKTGDNSHLHLANPSSVTFTVSGEDEDNTSSGLLYWKVVASGGNWVTEWYLTNEYLAGDLVAQSAAVAAGAAFQARERNASGLTITGTVGSAPVNGTTGTFDLNYHSVENSDGVPDGYRIAVTLTSTGEVSRILAAAPVRDGFGHFLNTTASGGERLADDRIKANSYPDMEGED